MRKVGYRWADVDGVQVFYREAGPPAAPALLLLHGFPSSSRMYEPLLTRLGDSVRLVAPDYPGFGHSAWPDPAQFAYTFDHLAAVTGRLTEVLGLRQYSLYLQDYGGPVGMRLAVAHPDRLQALWTDELAFLGQPGQEQIQLDLMYDYRTNVASYPAWQAWLREHRPPLLVLWGRYDTSFEAAEVQAYRRDVPDAETHLLDAGHFALNEEPDVMADLVRAFLARRVSLPPEPPRGGG
jgi:pimeloyl-ACP methyl ester carboxylesterase